MSAPAGRDRLPHPLVLHRRLLAVWAGRKGALGAAAVNHTVIARRFVITALAFFLLGGVLAMAIRAQLATARNPFLDHEAYAQVFTMHGTVMMFLFAIPMIEGVSLYLLPKMLGARDLAFPRFGAFGYWCYLFGGLILIAAFLMGLAPDAGWFMYTPLSGATYTPGIQSDVWLIGITFVEISAIGVAVELAVSILTMRTAGMSLDRMPIFAWYMLVTAGMMLLGFPPLILGSILLEIERAFGWPFFDPTGGGDPLLWQHLFWIFGHPEVYIIFLPAAGLVSTMIPVFARRPLVGYPWIVASIVAMGFISFGLWVHHMFTVGIPHLAQVFFSAASMLVAIPTAVQFFAWIATLWGGRPQLRLPMLYLFGFLVVFVTGGLTGVMLALVPFNWQVHDTHFVVAHLHYVLVGGFVFPVLAAAYYWYPHVTGRLPSVPLGTWAFWLIFIGFNTTFLVMHWTGLLGMPRRIYLYPDDIGWELPNLVSSIGGFVMTAGFALFLLDMLLHRRLGRRAPRDPWGADTLEWAMPTPAALYNFVSQPPVDGRTPLWDRPALPAEIAAGRYLLAEPRTGLQETLGVTMLEGRPSHVVVLPNPTLLPLVAALAMAAFFLSLLLKLYWATPVAAVAALAIFLRWGWSNGHRRDPAPIATGNGPALPHHSVVPAAPGWWGLVFTIIADGTLLASLLFGYAFLWLVAPGWPPPHFLDAPLLVPFGTAAALFAGAFAARRAAAANAAGASGSRAGWLYGATLAGLVAAAVLLWGTFDDLPPPASHAYAAVVAFTAGYLALHAAIGSMLAGFVALRGRAGFLSPQRTLDLRILRLWWDYTVAAGAVVLLALFGLPEIGGR